MTGDALQNAAMAYDSTVAYIGGCGDGYCIVTGKARGQHTNGGCRCFHRPCDGDGMAVRQLLLAARKLRDAVAKEPALPTDAEKLRTALEEIATGSIPDFDPGDDDAVWMLQERARAALSSTGGGE